MAFWSAERLAEELPRLVEPYEESQIDCAAYTLRVGSEVYVTPTHRDPNPSANTKVQLEREQSFTIPSGQFGFLLTEESVMVPDNAIALISIRAKAKFRGLVNISGFHVDPGYEGRLVFSVYNAGPSPIHLQRGMPLFLIWYADLDRRTAKHKGSRGARDLPLELLSGVSGEIFSPQALTSSMKDHEAKTERALSDLETSLSSRLSDAKAELTKEIHSVDKKHIKSSLVTGAVGAFLFVVLATSVGYFFREAIGAALFTSALQQETGQQGAGQQ